MTETRSVDRMPVNRIRLGFLDGVRGLAALYVLIFHSLTIAVAGEDQTLSLPMRILRQIFGYGHFGVSVFIVLSGFSLMLPIARSGSLSLDRGFRSYLRRRARRVMPAYYAALALSILSIAGAAVALDKPTDDQALSVGSILSHIFLVHNLNFDWAFRINGPMWSVATEWQIYFVFPFVLLPLWRRIGGAPTVALAWLVPLAFHLFSTEENNLSWAAPWFVGSFAFGMWGAMIAYSSARVLRMPWAQAGLGGLALLVVLLAGPGQSWPLLYLDFVVSATSLALILVCVRQLLERVSAPTLLEVTDGEPEDPGPLNAVLGSRPMVALGAFSYSLYLLQHPLLRFSEALLERTSLGYETLLWVQLIIGTPIIALISRVFAEFFEFPFTSGSRVVDSMRNTAVPSRVAASRN